MNRTDWNKLYRQIRSSKQPESIDANGRKFFIGRSGVKPNCGRAVLFDLMKHCRQFERYSVRRGTLRCVRKYRKELEDSVNLEISLFGQSDRSGLAFC